MPGYIIGDGSVLADDQVGRQVGELGPGVRLEDHAVDVLGFVWFEALELGYRIKLQPDRISEKAEAALYLMLAGQNIRRVLVTLVSDDGVGDNFYRSSVEAINGIGAAIAEKRNKRVRRFAKQAAKLSSLERFPALRQLLEFYRSNGSVMEPSRLQAMASEKLQGRFLLVQHGNDDALRIEALGPGYRGFDLQWSSRSRGTRIEDQPDLEYGAWLGQGYREALIERSPQIEVVDVIVYRPRLGRRRFGYRRLVLPYMAPTGGQHVLSASVTDAGVDLGVGQAVEVS